MDGVRKAPREHMGTKVWKMKDVKSRAPYGAWNKDFDKISWRHAFVGSYATWRWGDLGRSGVFPGDSLLLMATGSLEGDPFHKPALKWKGIISSLKPKTHWQEFQRQSGLGSKPFTCRLLSEVYMMVAWGGQSGPPTSLFRRGCCSAIIYDNFKFSAIYLPGWQLTQYTKWVRDLNETNLPARPGPYTCIWMVGMWCFQEKEKTPLCLCRLSTATDTHKCKCFAHFLLRSTTDPTINYFSSKTKEKCSVDFSRKLLLPEAYDNFIFLG